MNAEREARREAARREIDQLYYELIHNLVVETTRTGIEVKNLKMRVESVVEPPRIQRAARARARRRRRLQAERPRSRRRHGRRRRPSSASRNRRSAAAAIRLRRPATGESRTRTSPGGVRVAGQPQQAPPGRNAGTRTRPGAR